MENRPRGKYLPDSNTASCVVNAPASEVPLFEASTKNAIHLLEEGV